MVSGMASSWGFSSLARISAFGNQRSMRWGARKHDHWVNVDCLHGGDRGKARAAKAGGEKGMEAEVAKEASAGCARQCCRMARARRRGAGRSSESRPDHRAAICRLGPRIGVHL